MSGFDRFGEPTGSVPGPPPEADPAPGVLSVLWNFTADDDVGSAQRLADTLEEFVLEPTRWPAGVQRPQYVVNPPNPVSPLVDAISYGIAAELPGHPARLIVTGRRGSSPHEAGRHGWFAVSGLEHMKG